MAEISKTMACRMYIIEYTMERVEEKVCEHTKHLTELKLEERKW